MSLARAFTTKRSRAASDVTVPSMPSRSLTTKKSLGSNNIRNKISAPTALLSTTNMLSYTAPDIYPKTPSSMTSRSSNSDDDSASNPFSPTASINSSVASSSPTSPNPNHLSCYFGQMPPKVDTEEAPTIPQRAVSHTKKNAEILARKRSMSGNISNNSISTVRSSINMFSSAAVDGPDHPFGNELAKVTEIAEDYGITRERMTVVDEEEQELVSRGLFKFRAEDYMSEIQGFISTAFGEVKQPPMSAMWI
ncbi:hypothetical protein HYFRA_00005850 [Hymenoscyphus fraxineus]|uniref:Uncharacterized protein n=1 Tax=Hymenoscyphus fraxineus TaxID=746836 RepID=A0A9N9PSJ3_9HELO|nr:hypothetical protein HYFRA_00005850 [Hymenoscyphus fraxineus]